MKNLLQTLGGATIIFAAVSMVIYIGNIQKLRFFDINSPYVAVFCGLGIAIGILFAMVMILVQNYQMKMEAGQKLVQYLTTADTNE
jgi:xanthine/uracil permease